MEDVMEEDNVSFILGMIIGMSIILFVAGSTATSYEVIEIVEPNKEVTEKKCSCFGKLTIQEKYPPIHTCNGISICKPS